MAGSSFGGGVVVVGVWGEGGGGGGGCRWWWLWWGVWWYCGPDVKAFLLPLSLSLSLLWVCFLEREGSG